ncbi:MAG: acyl carrier protein [Bacilli bacterium]
MSTKREKILEEIKTKLNVKSLDMKASLNDLGLDSLDIVEYLLSIEEDYDVEFPPEEMEKLKTLGDVISLIETKVK